MNVLIADFDLFRAVGGGQTFYRSIIEKNPRIEFHYLVDHEPADAERPANAHPIRYQRHFAAGDWDDFCDVQPPRWCIPAFLKANNVAYSVRGLRFDVVDLPDYEQFGLFLRPAFEVHGVDVGRVALSLHGRISTSIELNWLTEGTRNAQLVAQEDMQFQTADLRYGLSRTYLDEWRAKFDLESHYFSPLRFIEVPEPTATVAAPEPADLLFVGRTEKRKGPDLFVELAWWLPRASYNYAKIVGPQSFDPRGTGSNLHLYTMANNRLDEKDLQLWPVAAPWELKLIFAARMFTVVPSRYDTFNLVATESLLAGCPTAIGSGAGVCRFIEETYPGVPFVKIDVDNPYAAMPEILDVLRNYDDYRQRLVDALKAAHPSIEGPSLEAIYRAAPAFDRMVRRELDDWYARLMTHTPTPMRVAYSRLRKSAVNVAHKVTTQPMRHRMRYLRPRSVVWAVKTVLRERLRATRLRDRLQTGRVLLQADPMIDRYRQIHFAAERTAEELERKLDACAELVSQMGVDRIRLWREMGRLESLRGNHLVAATYRLRAIRLAGGDGLFDLPDLAETLRRHGYEREAAAADVMYTARPDSAERCSALLDEAFSANRRCGHDENYEFVDDRRDRNRYKTSVIVSLYDAADKLPMFLRALSLQTMFHRGQAELVLIDSASPGDEYAALKQMAGDLQIPIVYARTARRETIQTAWNRGITLARGGYLSFLGVDEGLLPPALEVLAGELDADPMLDWVQANSLVTAVNEKGHWLRDIMVYDRANYQQTLAYLETCYLSWVGALYRRDLHDRLGFYDGSFGAAGDTEFKNRVLPFIKTKAIPRTLGVFWNYPSGQTTQSPRAELEDLRAWYLHRSAAGVRRAMERRGAAEAEGLLHSTLRYRKSYCRHWSTDIEYAHHLTQFLRHRQPNSAASRLHGGIETLLSAYRALDCLPRISAKALRRSLLQTTRLADQVAAEHLRLVGERTEPAYRVFNDNRYEQHTQIWRAAA
jgi:glycosyltransferase involved in cell wall biosynthesis